MVKTQFYCAKTCTFALKRYFKSKCNPRALDSNNRLSEDLNFLIKLLQQCCGFFC